MPSEEAKAVQEVARTTGKGIDAAREFGAWVAPFIGGSLEQVMGMFRDKLAYMRWERQVRLVQRAKQFLAERGLSSGTRPIPMKLAIPLLQAASLEEDDELQDIWANLLVNAADANSGVEIRRAYISILEELTPLDVRILSTIYSNPALPEQAQLLTYDLPDRIHTDKPQGDLPRPSEEVTLALGNLARLGCVTSATYLGDFAAVDRTVLGRGLYEACAAKRACR